MVTAESPTAKTKLRHQRLKIVDLRIMIRALLGSLSIALAPAFVNGMESSKPQSSNRSAVRASSATPAFQSQIAETLLDGKAKLFDGITRFPEIAKGNPTRMRWLLGKDTLDDHRRWFRVILDSSTVEATPVSVELFVEEKDHPASISNQYYFLLGLDGKLKQCGHASGPLGENGKYKPGPAFAPFKYLDKDSPETRARLKRELDFWLKGIGRKSPAQKPETSKDGKSR